MNNQKCIKTLLSLPAYKLGGRTVEAKKRVAKAIVVALKYISCLRERHRQPGGGFGGSSGLSGMKLTVGLYG